ncbi:hypothetical protein VE00_10818 [Pseudogymnoascus sp. WSF 3629]|nr:hypothetical protein VE00_10818 [Pseudogymnoascus sp. WSF 3629]
MSSDSQANPEKGSAMLQIEGESSKVLDDDGGSKPEQAERAEERAEKRRRANTRSAPTSNPTDSFKTWIPSDHPLWGSPAETIVEAVRAGDLAKVASLVADASYSPADYLERALIAAVRADQLEIRRYLLDHGAEMDKPRAIYHLLGQINRIHLSLLPLSLSLPEQLWPWSRETQRLQTNLFLMKLKEVFRILLKNLKVVVFLQMLFGVKIAVVLNLNVVLVMEQVVLVGLK